MALTVIALNVLGWGMLAAAAGGHYHINRTEVFGFGTGTLAYTLGMRHAFDADHISAIDNTARKFLNDGKRPLSVGFFFSLGHSTVVFALAVLLNFGIRGLDDQVKNSNSSLQHTTNIIGTSVSAFFLLLIAVLNMVILVGILKIFGEMRSGTYDDAELERQLNQRGLMNRFLGPLARRIDTPWKMYPIGFLFGLGFDTATEVALLVLAGTAVVGGLLGQDAHLGGGFWSFLENFDINKAGFVIVGVFIVTWVVALAVWRFANIEQRWQPALASQEPTGPEP
jgi:high-affinity nickel-transport protein